MQNYFGQYLIWMLLTLMPLLQGCKLQGQELPQGQENTTISRGNLLRSFRASGKMLVVYPARSADADKYRSTLEKWSKAARRSQFVVLPDTSLSEEMASQLPLFLIGSPQEHLWLQKWADRLPFSLQNDSLQFLDRRLPPSSVLQIGFYPNPIQPSLPLCISTALHTEDLLPLFEQAAPGYGGSWAGSWGYQLKEGGITRMLGFFEENGPLAWKSKGELHWDLSPLPKVAESDGWIGLYHELPGSQQAEIEELLEHIRLQRQTLEAQLGPIATKSPLQVHIYPDLESKGMATGHTEPAHLEGNRLNISLHSAWKGFGIPEANQHLLAEKIGSEAAQASLGEGISICHTPNWQGSGWENWAAVLYANGDAPNLEQVLATKDAEYESSLYLGCFRAAAASFFATHFGPAKMLSMKPAEYQQPQFLQALESDWQKFLQDLPKPVFEKSSSPALPLLKGFNLAHEGYQIYNGYCSQSACKSVQYTQSALNSNTVSIIPYTGINDVRKAQPFHFSGGAGGESDESVINCAWSAKSKGMVAMLKPQIWSWNNWTGAIEMENEAEWQLFFEHYYRWMRHYAILAEMHDIPMLCIGVELSKAALQRPEDWKAMVKKIRGIYHGKLVYAANWGEEFEQINWWKELDYIGLNSYYPLSKKEKVSQKELDEGFRGIVATMEKVVEKYQMPLLLTEIGFSSYEGTWKQPHADPDQQAQSDKAQTMCYEAMFKALEGKPWLAGIYLWKWPSFLPDHEKDARSFSPYKKPAEALIKEWYGRL